MKLLEDITFLTHWGKTPENDRMKTATEIINDSQPLTQRLDKYSNVAEAGERILTEWIANFLFEGKPKDKQIASVSYGRNYAILPAATALEMYQQAKEKGDNATILDRLFNEYLMSKHKSDPVAFAEALLKAEVEPYLHYTIDQVNDIFGREEAQRKMLFEDWWRSLDSRVGVVDSLKSDYDKWFEENRPQESLNIET